ncbi:unnamed protein product [Arctia plantaginis]|uniref:Uncharacterized protein n=1 Tax=Arctia plantaginis TaxID=874455 RepID=A0A8S0ZN62_ARCPL|nr:unnamed protein product [Arctia plantaginis]CAB3242015.1 unnamed protein product [Arctia plantaginis]
MQIEGAEIKWSLVVQARAIDTPALRPCRRPDEWAGRGKRLGLVSPAYWHSLPPPQVLLPRFKGRTVRSLWRAKRRLRRSPHAAPLCGYSREQVTPCKHCFNQVRYVSRLVLLGTMITDMYAPLPAPPTNKTIVSSCQIELFVLSGV